MSNPWKYIPTEFPADGSIVWVKILGNPQPFLASWDSATPQWRVDGVGYSFPWWQVVNWKPQ